MPSFAFLKHFDFFKLPVQIYYTSESKRTKKKKFHTKLGTYFGFYLSAVIVGIGLMYLF